MTEEDEPHGHRPRLRERCLQSALEGVADDEAVELWLTLAIPQSDVKQPRRKLSPIAGLSHRRGILDARMDEWRTVSGVGSPRRRVTTANRGAHRESGGLE